MDSIIQGLKEKINLVLGDGRTFTSMVLVLVAIGSFGLGRQSVGTGNVTPIESGGPAELVRKEATFSTSTPLPSTHYVASKNGQVYHLPHCSGAKNISATNKITFASKAEAEAAGYRPAANCKGI